MNALKPKPPFQILIMSEESRLGRESIETGYAFKQLVTAGVRVFLYMEDRKRTLDSPTDKIMMQLGAFADELEREKARQRTYDAMRRMARAGHVTGGRVFGYDNIEVRSAGGDRSHVVRRINEAEAEVICLIFDKYLADWGLASIAKFLNENRLPSPRSQQGPPAGWAASSVREVLQRDLYRGVVVWNKTKKRSPQGTIQQRPRPESEWVSVEAPDLRIIADGIWSRVQLKFSQNRKAGLRGGRPPGSGAKYLLTGLLRCQCGSSFEALSGTHGKRRAFVYGCAAQRRKGRTICANDLVLPMAAGDEQVFEAVMAGLLTPSILSDAVQRAMTELSRTDNQTGPTLEEQAVALRAELQRLASAVATGGDSPTLLAAIQGDGTSAYRVRSSASDSEGSDG